MMLKTFAILLSLGTAYSTATYAMDWDPNQKGLSTPLQRIRAADFPFSTPSQSTHATGFTLSTASQGIRAAEEELSSSFQKIPAERAAREVALQQMKEKLDAEDRKLRDAVFRNLDALNDLTTSDEERAHIAREFEELKQNVCAAKEAVVKEYEEQFGLATIELKPLIK